MATLPNPDPGTFDFGLSEAQEARARKLHAESIVIDMLSQQAGGNIFAYYPPEIRAEFHARCGNAPDMNTMWTALDFPYEMSRLGKSHLVGDWMKQGGVTCGTYSVGVDDRRDRETTEDDERTIANGKLPWRKYITTAAGIRQAKRDGAVAAFANCQPVYPKTLTLKAFDAAYEKGLRSYMLTYNVQNCLGTGCTERVDAGISMFGVDVVRHMNEIGMIVDTSHCGHQTTLDACRQSRRPVTANHTTAKSLYGHPRGKSNDALKALADTGGVIGVVALPYFLSGEEVVTIETMLDHIDYIADLVGWQHVAIGTDWPMQAPDDLLVATLGSEGHFKNVGWRKEFRRDVTQRVIGYDDVRDFPNITRGLVKRGYSDEQIRGILGENALRVFADVWGG